MARTRLRVRISASSASLLSPQADLWAGEASGPGSGEEEQGTISRWGGCHREKEQREGGVTLPPGPHGCGCGRGRALATFPTSSLHCARHPGSAPCSPRATLGPGDPPFPPPAAAWGRPADTPLPSPSHAASEDLGEPPVAGDLTAATTGGGGGGTQAASRPAPPANRPLAPRRAGAVPRPHDTHSGSAQARLMAGPQSSRGPAGLAIELDSLPSRGSTERDSASGSACVKFTLMNSFSADLGVAGPSHLPAGRPSGLCQLSPQEGQAPRGFASCLPRKDRPLGALPAVSPGRTGPSGLKAPRRAGPWTAPPPEARAPRPVKPGQEPETPSPHRAQNRSSRGDGARGAPCAVRPEAARWPAGSLQGSAGCSRLPRCCKLRLPLNAGSWPPQEVLGVTSQQTAAVPVLT
uniref:Uncharacterized protein n=1 Tax=Rangifer tarandus platyrhynchus TaxID=3082113 RepID=A0ACB0DZN8_RANTA|nr:unnamed protein product [Rangifer tarandus platyrhynchus]